MVSKRIKSIGIIASLTATVLMVGCGTTEVEKGVEAIEIEISTEEEEALLSDLEEANEAVKISAARVVTGQNAQEQVVDGKVLQVFPQEIMEALKGLSVEERKAKIQEFIDSSNYDEDMIAKLERLINLDGPIMAPGIKGENGEKPAFNKGERPTVSEEVDTEE